MTNRRSRIAATLFPLVALALAPACVTEDGADSAETEDTSETTSALTGATNPVDCGFDDGRTCKSTTTLANNVTDTVQWDPCFGGVFTWTATGSFEPLYDRACVGGKATAGSSGGCDAGYQLTGSGPWSGNGYGPTTLSLATDVSVASAGLTKLTATCNEPLFVGVFRGSSNATGQQIVFGEDWTTFQSTWSTKSGQGKRLSKIEIWYDTDGTMRFDGVFTAGSGPYGLNPSMTFAQLQQQRITNAANGMEISDIDALQTGNGITYFGVWRAGTRTQKIFDGLVSDFWSWANLNAPNYQPSAVESYYDASGNHRYTVVMTLTPNVSGWGATVGVEYGEFANEWKKWRDQGVRLAQLETHVVNGVRFYDGFFVQASGSGEDFVPGTRYQEFLGALSRDTTAGLELIDLDRAKHARTAGDATLEEKLARTEYPVVAPVWMAQAEDYFYSNWGKDSIGYTVALMKNGRLLGASSVGYAKSPADGGVRLTADAQWDYLSDSKWITSLAAAKVAEEQNININSTLLIKAIAPQVGLVWQNTASTTDFWHISVKQAMTHTSNLFDGGCDNGPAVANWNMAPGPAMQRPGGTGMFSYSGYDACFLRVWVELRTGMPFEQYVATHLFRANGIHNLDCQKDPEKVEVLQYVDPNDTAPGRSEGNTYCAAAGFKGTPLQMLKILQMVRVPGRALATPMLDAMRNGSTAAGDEWTFFQSAFDVDGNGTPEAYGYSMTGGRVGMRTHIAQFPSNPFDGTAPFTTAAYASGIDAVFFTNAGPGNGPNVQWASMQADPNP